MAIDCQIVARFFIGFRQYHAVSCRNRGAGRAVVDGLARELDLLDAALRAEGRQGEGVWAGFGRCIAEAGYEEAPHFVLQHSGSAVFRAVLLRRMAGLPDSELLTL